ncbi:cleft lip and palate transmembrane 1, partial [Martensiomyces pterosporus]
ALAPYWKLGERVSLRLYISEDRVLANDTIRNSTPEWQVDDILYGDTSINYEADLSIAASESVQNNGTLYAHALFSRKESPVHPENPRYDPDSVSLVTWPLTYYVLYHKPVHVKKLVEFPHRRSAKDAAESKQDPEAVATAERQKGEQERREAELDGKLVSYWYPNLTLAVVDAGSDYYPYAQEPPAARKWIKVSETLKTEAFSNLTYYKPIFYVNDFWRLQERMYMLNETTPTLPLHVQLNSLSLWKFRIFCSMDPSEKQQSALFGEDLSMSGMDDFKRMLADTNPVLLAVTFTVTILHSLFDFLAFKNDVQFWRKKKDTVGVSVRTMLMQLAFEIIILLYLFDNREGTSYMILISNTVSVAIEAWKVVRALDLKVVRAAGYVVTIKAYEAMTEEESNTREYDQIAYRYLSYLAYPLLLAYAIYALFTQEQKSWYSFILSVLVGYVYTFGFMMMIPQLYINYRLKSVAHMPWRTFAYKALSTFIDDLFSWVMKMPWLHRLATLRDDVVFIVYLYQRYIYRVDHSRANEYGQVGEE